MSDPPEHQSGPAQTCGSPSYAFRDPPVRHLATHGRAARRHIRRGPAAWPTWPLSNRSADTARVPRPGRHHAGYWSPDPARLALAGKAGVRAGTSRLDGTALLL